MTVGSLTFETFLLPRDLLLSRLDFVLLVLRLLDFDLGLFTIAFC